MTLFRNTKNLLAVIALTLCGCDVTDPINEPTLPGSAKVTLTTDWSNRAEDVDIPSSYQVELNNQSFTFSDAVNSLPELEAGIYPLWVYNPADKITIAGGTATVTTQNNIADPLPGWFFSAVQDITYEAGKEKQVTAVMQQQIRQLTIQLTVKESDPAKIAQLEATLTGIANTLDMRTNTHEGNGISVVPSFTSDGGKITSHIRLLGVTGTQTLTLTLTFTDGKSEVIETDLTAKLNGFNTNKYMPLILTADINIPVGTDFQATITGWETTEENGEAW